MKFISHATTQRPQRNPHGAAAPVASLREAMVLFKIITALALALSLNATLPAAPPGKAPKAGDEVVELPKYVVTGKRELPPPESWRYVRIPGMVVTLSKKNVKDSGREIVLQGFEVLSNDLAKNVTALAHELQLRQYAGTVFWPEVAAIQYSRPPLIIHDRLTSPLLVTGSDSGWEAMIWADSSGKSGPTPLQTLEALQAVSDASQGSIYDQNSPNNNGIGPDTGDGATTAPPNIEDVLSAQMDTDLGASALPKNTARLLSRDGIVIIKMATGLDGMHVDSVGGLVTGQLFTNGAAQSKPPLPYWLLLGLDWLVRTTNTSMMGKIEFGSRPMAVSRRNLTIAPLKVVLEESYGKPVTDWSAAVAEKAADALALASTGTTPEAKWETASKDATATAFVDFGLYGDFSDHSAAFQKFVDRARSGEPVNEQMFKECFNMTYAQMDKLLLRFVSDSANFRTNGIQGKPKFPSFEVREATQSEIACIVAAQFQVTGEPQRALEVVRIAYARGERAPRLLAELAYWESKIGDMDKARQFVAALKGQKLTTDRALVAETRVRFHDAQAAPGQSGKLKPDDTMTLLKYVAAVTKMQPVPTEEICELGADIILKSEGAPAGGIVTFLQNGARLYPKNTKIQQALALAGAAN